MLLGPQILPQLTESQTWSIIMACVMMLADIITGFTGAAVRHDISSTKMREGIGHKIMILVLIAVAYVLGVGLGHVSGINAEIPSTEVVCWYVVVMEIASILENISNAWPEFSGTSLFKYISKIAGDDEDERKLQ